MKDTCNEQLQRTNRKTTQRKGDRILWLTVYECPSCGAKYELHNPSFILKFQCTAIVEKCGRKRIAA